MESKYDEINLMARIYPDLSASELNAIESVAEARIYSALKNKLSDKFLVIFQPRWILKTESAAARDGETDFLIAHPDWGYFCIEVKGGGINFDGSSWSSVDKLGNQHSIKDPIKQAMGAKYAIRQKLDESNGSHKEIYNSVATGHAVFFPDVDDKDAFVRPDLPQQLVGTRGDLGAIEVWIMGVFRFWAKESHKALGEPGIKLLQKRLANEIHVDLTVGAQLEYLEQKRVQLTQNQMAVLDFISSHRRAAICGGAGTGKTLLAIEKVRRLADEGFKTLLICFNRELSYSLALQFVDYPNVTVTTFHKLCQYFINAAQKISGVDFLQQARTTFPNEDLYSIHLPIALSYSMDVVDLRYDAIVCDEAQDFGEEFWMPIELALKDLEKSPFYIFYDTHQNLYSRALTFPIPESPFTLRQNCRNSKQIHEFAYESYQGPAVDAPSNDGPPVHFIEEQLLQKQALLIQTKISNLLTRGSVLPHKIVVLIGDSLSKAVRYSLLESLVLPNDTKWIVEGGVSKGAVLIDTVKRFKGLESEIVLIWGLPIFGSFDFDEVLYVGATRAVSDLTFVGDKAEIAQLKR